MMTDTGQMNKSFFLETTNIIEAKLYTSDHLMGSCKVVIFYVDPKFKMAAIEKMFYNYTPRNKVVGGYTGFTMSVCRQILCHTIT